MLKFKHLSSIYIAIFSVIMLTGCIGEDSSSDTESPQSNTYTYNGIPLYSPDMSIESYKLTPYSDSKFNSLSDENKMIVADKLLSTFYFGIPKEELITLIESGVFISTINNMIRSTTNDLALVENRLNNSGNDAQYEFNFTDSAAGAKEVAKILARFYVLEDLDKEYINYWSAYVLASTIMFSPAYELPSSQDPNIERVYSSLVRAFRDEYTIEYSTFLHMISEDNWRRFRSPEDNGREMLEVFLQDFNDDLVPIAAQALKNWHLDGDHDTLVIGLDENTQPLQIYGFNIVDGYDFYAALVKASHFNQQVTSRLVNIYFPTFTRAEKNTIISSIVSSNPNTWKDILLQIVFSERYLNDSDKTKGFEELFFSLGKKIHYKHRKNVFNAIAQELESMNQSSMKYKLGRYVEVPLDTQSFITYHKTIRERLLIRYNNETSYIDYNDNVPLNRGGWLEERLLADSIFVGDNDTMILENLIDHLFISVIARTATQQEKDFFIGRMLTDGEFISYFDINPFSQGNYYYDRDVPHYYRRYATILIMDYLSRLSENYKFKKV